MLHRTATGVQWNWDCVYYLEFKLLYLDEIWNSLPLHSNIPIRTVARTRCKIFNVWPHCSCTNCYPTLELQILLATHAFTSCITYQQPHSLITVRIFKGLPTPSESKKFAWSGLPCLNPYIPSKRSRFHSNGSRSHSINLCGLFYRSLSLGVGRP